jgi:transcriptional regulator with XRE-family HTH domain
MEGQHDARDLGLSIKQLCDITGISWNKLSRRSGISKRSLNRYVKGEVMPTPQTLSRIAAVFSVSAGIFDRLAPRCRASRRDVEEALRQGAGEPPGLEERIGSAALAAMAPFLQQLDQLDRDATPRAEDRLWADALWARWEPLPDEERSRHQEIVVDMLLGDERSWALAERLCLASEAAAANRADEALRLAQLAVGLAGRVPGEDWRLRLLGWVEPFLASAQRVGGDLAASAESLARADDLWERGAAGAPAGLLVDARRLDLKASLLMHYGRFGEVDSLLAAALKDARSEPARGRLLIKLARNRELAGRYEEALGLLAQAKPLLDAVGDTRLLFAHDFNKTVTLLHLDRYGEAEELLPQVEARTDPGNELDGIRLRWLQGRTWAGLGRRLEALEALARVRGYFHAEAIAYDYAVVSVELGTILLEEGRAREVRELAEEMMWIFKSQGIHQEALEALALFCHAAKAEQAQLDWARRLVKYLYRAQSNPGMKFAETLLP